MTSVFASRMAAAGTPAGLRFNGETVLLHTVSGPKEISALFVEDQPITSQGNNTPTMFTGRLRILAADLCHLHVNDTEPTALMTARDHVWHLGSPGQNDVGGMVPIDCWRHSGHNRHSGILTIDEEQAMYPKP